MRYSHMETFMQCPQKYKYAYVDKLEKIEKGEESNDKEWGSAIHKGLEVHYQGKCWEDVKKAFSLEYPANLKEEDLAKTAEGGLKCLEAYITHYKDQDKVWKVLGTEVADHFEFDGIEWELHIDLIAENLQGGGIYFWDHKTTANKLAFGYWKKYELDSQISAYSEYIRQKYGQCSGALINGIQVGHRQRAYKGEPAGYHFKFERQIFNRTKEQLAYWKKNQGEWIKRLEWSEKENVWGLHEGMLCSYCEFRELCIGCNDEEIKSVLYQVKESGE